MNCHLKGQIHKKRGLRSKRSPLFLSQEWRRLLAAGLDACDNVMAHALMNDHGQNMSTNQGLKPANQQLMRVGDEFDQLGLRSGLASAEKQNGSGNRHTDGRQQDQTMDHACNGFTLFRWRQFCLFPAGHLCFDLLPKLLAAISKQPW